MRRNKGVRRSSPPAPTVARPWVDLAHWVVRVYFVVEPVEVNLVCPDTGLVVYTTPTRNVDGDRSTWAACRRAKAWLHRNGFVYNPVDHGRYSRVKEGVLHG